MSYRGCLSIVPKATIDSEGVFKYIQIYCEDIVTKESLIVVRGFKRCEYHPDIFDEFNGKYIFIIYLFNFLCFIINFSFNLYNFFLRK